jgi:hypothetical protein
MSEAKKESTPKTAEKKSKAAVALPGEKKVTKSPWTLDKCMKTARRFSNEKDWAHGCPAAYKSASAHGWLAKCTAGMSGRTPSKKTA